MSFEIFAKLQEIANLQPTIQLCAEIGNFRIQYLPPTDTVAGEWSVNIGEAYYFGSTLDEAFNETYSDRSYAKYY